MRHLRTPALIVLLLLGATATWHAQSSWYTKSIFFENFDGGIPGTWTVVDGYGDGITWTTVDPSVYNLGDLFNQPPAAIIDSDRHSLANLDELLITPTIDVSACRAPINIEFANMFKAYGGDLLSEVADLDLSTNGGGTWTNLLKMTADDGPELQVLHLAPYPRESSSLKVRFHYYNARDEFWWLVDDINVYCDCAVDHGSPTVAAIPAGGTYSTTQSVTLSCEDTIGCGCKAIHYTLDGSEPTTGSPVFSGPIAVADDTTIKFFAIDFGGNQSTIATESFTVATPVAPVANAGAAQTVHVGTQVTLDGSKSSDADQNYPLGYTWTLLSVPGGSVAVLSDTSIPNPSFIADKEGNYAIQLLVRDDQGLQSEPATVIVSTTNSAPKADAGEGGTVHISTMVTLEGGGTDPDGDEIASFVWTMTRPQGSSAQLSDSTAARPTITLDVVGDYEFSLVVTDCWGSASAPSKVTVSTTNTPPEATITADPQAVQVLGTIVNLDAIASYDLDGDPVTYSWAFTTTPPGSAAKIQNATNVTASFVADTHGDYVIELTVTDCWNAKSEPVTLTVSFENLAPTADPGVNQSVNTGSLVSLDGSGSSDPNNDALTYQWSILTRPSGSLAALAGDQTPIPTFTVDLEGSYTIQLIVNDGLLFSAARTATVTATSVSAQAVEALTGAIEAINAVDLRSFKNKNMRNTLTTKINVIIEQIRLQQYDEAAAKLQNDVLAKLDGCGAAPDPNDWIIYCQAQWNARQLLIEALNILKGL